ncbi:tRNA 2-thiouridine(34) synthase MnmA [Fibrobacterota bacterium]
MKNNEYHILAALSGGVDSSVVLKLLKPQFKRIMGVSHRHWPESRCCSSALFESCRRQCNEMSVEYRVVDTMVDFTEEIVDPFVRAYRSGETPNPCVYCNQKIRFGKMVGKALQNRGGPEDFRLATGHYARILKKNGRYWLQRGLDEKKDQSYMLYRLSQEQLQRSLFPLGEFTKSQVREKALAWDLSSSKNPESQDICFIQDDYRKFIRQYTGIEESPGDFIDQKGNKLGSHQGISGYNRGMRKGLGLSGGPWYVLAIRPESNTVVLGSKEELLTGFFHISECVWHLPEVPDTLECKIQVRYHGPELDGRVNRLAEDTFQISLDTPSADISPGQSAVFYSGNTVLGGGIIRNDL